MSNSAYDAGVQFGQFMMGLVFLGLVGWGIVAISRNNAQKARPIRDPRFDLALLARIITVHGTAEQALAIVAGIAAASGRLVPGAGPAAAWWIDGAHPVVALEPTPAGSVLAVRELVIPLPSPHGAILWDWFTTQVEFAAARDGVQTSRSTQRFVLTRQLDAFSAIWAPAA